MANFKYGIINPDGSLAIDEEAESVNTAAGCLLWEAERSDGDEHNGVTDEVLATTEERLRDIKDRAESTSTGFRFPVGKYTFFCEVA